MAEKITATIEDYLGVMYVLERDGEPPVGARLAEHLGVKPPTVTNSIKRMVRDGLATVDAKHVPHLTEKGQEAARNLMRKHMLAELMLAHFSIPWSKVHKHAHEIEHAISDELEQELVTALGHPDICPHGNPLPGREDSVTPWLRLIDAQAGVPWTIRRIHELAEDNEELLAFLEENHIQPGQTVTILDVLTFNQTMNLMVGGKNVSLGLAVARYIYVG